MKYFNFEVLVCAVRYSLQEKRSKTSSRDLRDVTWQGQRLLNVYPLAHTQLCDQRSLEWVGPAMMCSQSPHCPDSPGTPSPTPSLTPQLLTFLPPELPSSLLLLLSQGQLLLWNHCLRSFGDASLFSWRSSLAATMVHSSSSSSICRFLLLVLLGVLVAFVHTGKPPVESDSNVRFIFLLSGDKYAISPACAAAIIIKKCL